MGSSLFSLRFPAHLLAVLQGYVYFIDVPRVVVIGSIPAVTWAEQIHLTTETPTGTYTS